MKNQIAINILSNYAGRIVGMAIGFFIIPFLILKLGKESYGTIALFESLILLAEAVSNSIRVALSRHATFTLSQGNKQAFTSYLSTGRGILFGLSLIVLAAGLFANHWIVGLFRVPEDLVHECRVLFSLMIFAFSITVPNIVFWSGLYAKQRFDLINVAVSGGLIFRGLAVLVLFSVLPRHLVTLQTYGLIYLIMTWSQNVMIYIAYKKVLPEVKLRLVYFRLEKAREILSFGFFTMTSHMSDLIHGNLINILVNRFWGPAGNAIFSVGLKFPLLLDKIFYEATWTLTPAFTDMVAKGQTERLKNFLFSYTKVLAFIAAPICMTLIAFAPSIIRLWVGPEFRESVVLMMIAHAFQFFYLPAAGCHNLPNALGKVKAIGIITPLLSFCSIFMCYALAVGGFKMPGVATGTGITQITYMVLFAVPYSMAISGFPLGEFWKNAYLKPLLWAAAYGGAGLFLLDKLQAGPFEVTPWAFCIWAALLPGYIWGGYHWVMDPKDRASIRGLFSLRKQAPPEELHAVKVDF